MDQLINKASSTLVTFAVRSGVQLASQYVAKTIGTVLEKVPVKEKAKIARMERELKCKFTIVSNAMESLQLNAIKGGLNLNEVMELSKDLNDDIDEFQNDLNKLIMENNGNMTIEKVKFLKVYIKTLIDKLDSLVPLINLVLSMSDQSLLNKFQHVVSPNRLLNATSIMCKSNEEFNTGKGKEVQIGNPISITLYDVFYNNNVSKDDDSFIIWKEKFTRANLTVIRTCDEHMDYVYDLRIIENFNDGRYHDDDDDDKGEGIEGKRFIDLRQINRVFFSASGKLLKIEDKSTPVLVLKVNKLSKVELANLNKINELDDKNEENFTWLAIGDFEMESDSDSDSDSNFDNDNLPKINGASPLALLEYIIRLCSLQSNDQIPILKASDERLMTYLADETNLKAKTTNPLTLNSKLENLHI